jgi:alkylation response protein AidB-like acyl-CoA dehydrogenase
MLHRVIRDYGPSHKDDRRREVWRELADLGVLGLPFPAEFGGAGGNALDILLTMEAFGVGLCKTPFVASIILGGGLIRNSGDPLLMARYLPRLASGDLVLTAAFAEPNSRFNLQHVETTAIADADGYRINGQKIAVLDAAIADEALVVCRTKGLNPQPSGISIFRVDIESPGIFRRDYLNIDGSRASNLSFEDVHVPTDALMGSLHDAFPVLERTIDEATNAICSEAVGVMETLNSLSVDYAKTRHAFGGPISNFQAIQHKLVDMHVSYEQAAAITLKAALSLATNEDRARCDASAAKILVGSEADFVGRNAIQIHGAIGMTDELQLGHYFRRLKVLETMFGTREHHLNLYINRQREIRHGN